MGLKANTILELPCIINAGLCSDSDFCLTPEQRATMESSRLAKWYLHCSKAGATRMSLQHSATEPIFIAFLPQTYFRPWLRRLVAETSQNCIAVYYPTIRNGCLVGNNPQSVGGEFLREFFVLFDGSRLGDNLSM